jgi:serine/threonine protein phosphatase PrpC
MKNASDHSKEKSKEKKPYYPSKNKTKNDNHVINSYTNKKYNRSNKKGMNCRNGENDRFNQKRNGNRNSNSVVGSKSKEKKNNNNKLITNYHKFTKSNLTNNSKDIYTEYSLCQKEIKLLIDKEEELKTLKNELRLQDKNKSNTNINNITDRNNKTYWKKKNFSQILDLKKNSDEKSKTSTKFYKPKNKKHNYSILTDLNSSNPKSINYRISNSYKNHFQSYSNDKINRKKYESNKGFINNNTHKKGININLFPDFKQIVCNTSDSQLNKKKIKNKGHFSFKKVKKNITNLNKTTYPKTTNHKSSSMIKNYNSIKNTKKSNINKYCRINKAQIKDSKSLTSSINPKTNSKAAKKREPSINKKNNEKIKKEKLNNESNKKQKNENEIKNPEEKKEEENIIKIRNIEGIGIISKAGEDNPGEEKINQDSYFNSDISNGYKFLGVCDGHGEDGHNISDYLQKNLPEELDKELKKVISDENKRLTILECMIKKNREALLGKEEDNNENTEPEKNEEEERMKLITSLEHKEKLKELFKKVFISTNIKLVEENYMYNLENSGSTCISLLLQKNDIKKIYVANVGDSRAIIVKQPSKNNNSEDINNDSWSFEQLSRDHKLTEQDEVERILKHGGEIEQAQNDNGEYEGPFRLYMKNEDGPGLAMSRSFGDVIGSVLGVIAEPEVTEYIIKNEDKAIIIASDGLYEYVSNQEITDVVKNTIDKKDPNLIVNELYKVSLEQWKKKEGGIDDITIICILLN